MNEENNEQNNQQQDSIERHIDIAIEAQDGKTDANTDQNSSSAGGEQNASQQTDTNQQQNNQQSGAGNDGTQQQPNKEGKKEGEQTPHSGKDLNTNEGVVKAGQERRFYEQRNIARQQHAESQKEVARLQGELKSLQDKFDAGHEAIQAVHGIDANTLRLGATIVKDLQRDPVGTINKLLAEAKAQGYNLDDIGSGVDTAAITKLIDDKFAALNGNANNNQPTEAEIIADAKKEADTFFNQYPDARPHDKLLASVLRDYPNLSLQDAYYEIKNGFAEKGFDFTLSLEDNLKALDGNQQQNNGDGNNQQQQNNRAPLPNGGNAANAAITTADVVTVADGNEDTGDIVKQAMREAGLNI